MTGLPQWASSHTASFRVANVALWNSGTTRMRLKDRSMISRRGSCSSHRSALHAPEEGGVNVRPAIAWDRQEAPYGPARTARTNVLDLVPRQVKPPQLG
jgi:hypothetical protein